MAREHLALLGIPTTARALFLARTAGAIPVPGGHVVRLVLRERPLAPNDPLHLADAVFRGVLELGEEAPRPRFHSVEAHNRGDRLVIALGGERLTGGFQDRIVAATVTVPPKSRASIPVVCSEVSRWQGDSARLRPVGATVHPTLRASLVRQARGALYRRAGCRGDQLATWREIGAYLEARGVFAPTGNYEASALGHAPWPRRTMRALRPLPEQAGVAFVREDYTLGSLDLFPSPEVYARVHHTLIRGFTAELPLAPRFAQGVFAELIVGSMIAALRRIAVVLRKEPDGNQFFVGASGNLTYLAATRDCELVHLAVVQRAT